MTTSSATPFLSPLPKQLFPTPPRLLIIGAGSRGTAYARSALSTSNAIIVSVCEPNEFKRNAFGRKFIWGDDGRVPAFGEAWPDWKDWVEYERERRKVGGGRFTGRGGFREVVVDAVFVCVLDEGHEE